MSNEEYTFSEKKRVIEEILMPFFQQQTPDTSHVDYILVLKECILKFNFSKKIRQADFHMWDQNYALKPHLVSLLASNSIYF